MVRPLSTPQREEVRIEIEGDLSKGTPRDRILNLLKTVGEHTSYFNGTTPDQLNGTKVSGLDRIKLEAAIPKVEGLAGEVFEGVLTIVTEAEDPDGSAHGHSTDRFAS